ncbi:MAG: hypothetical protein IT446_16180 [Phycisphaerales bacterium]|nr:hypothetical protein [Phycisphaerales bacterium]
MKRLVTGLWRFANRTHVRPWGLATPILVLLVALPLLRPLRHPDPMRVSDDEMLRLATIQSLAEQGNLIIDQTAPADVHGVIWIEGHRYSSQTPGLAAMLAGPYWAMQRLGYNLRDNSILVPYLLTLIGATLPVAAAGGLVYRMGRLFELRRLWRMALAMAVVFGGGLISYASVLNAHAPAATAVLASAACLIHLAVSRKPTRGGGWLLLAGLCAGVAMIIEPTAAIFFVLLAGVIPTMRWPIGLRLGGVILFVIGALPAVALHVALTAPAYGSWMPAEMLLPRLPADNWTAVDGVGPSMAAEMHSFADEESPAAPTVWMSIGKTTGRLLEALLGSHGLFSHFPLVIVALAGIGAVMHRHWPTSTKALAVAAAAGSAAIILAAVLSRAQWSNAMFASRWFIVFLPMLMFWIGAWLRRNHRPMTWAIAGVLATFSVTVSLIGAGNPYPRGGFDGYTPVAALRDGSPAPALMPPPAHERQLAGG